MIQTGTEWFRVYMCNLEQEVIVKGVDAGNVGVRKLAATRDGKLAGTPFGRLIGLRFDAEIPLVIDYYGHTKRSSGFFEAVLGIEGQVRLLEALVVHFAALRIELVADMAPGLVAGFPRFKKLMLRERGFMK